MNIYYYTYYCIKCRKDTKNIDPKIERKIID